MAIQALQVVREMRFMGKGNGLYGLRPETQEIAQCGCERVMIRGENGGRVTMNRQRSLNSGHLCRGLRFYGVIGHSPGDKNAGTRAQNRDKEPISPIFQGSHAQGPVVTHKQDRVRNTRHYTSLCWL
jgi:hypothetical protein